MEGFLLSLIASLFHLVIGGAVFGILVYLIVKRVQEKENENFEDRDN